MLPQNRLEKWLSALMVHLKVNIPSRKCYSVSRPQANLHEEKLAETALLAPIDNPSYFTYMYLLQCTTSGLLKLRYGPRQTKTQNIRSLQNTLSVCNSTYKLYQIHYLSHAEYFL
jgi:hypothetical protein